MASFELLDDEQTDGNGQARFTVFGVVADGGIFAVGVALDAGVSGGLSGGECGRDFAAGAGWLLDGA